jgi:hypothetical protein
MNCQHCSVAIRWTPGKDLLGANAAPRSHGEHQVSAACQEIISQLVKRERAPPDTNPIRVGEKVGTAAGISTIAFVGQ